MKIIGVVGSPRKKGNTSRAVGWILESAQEQGAEVEMVDLSDLNIGYCKGCNRCFIEGECPQEDDLGQLHRKMIDSDGIVFGAPSFVMHVLAQAKTFIDRSAFMSHRPQLIGKPCVSVSLSSAGLGQDTVAEYLNSVLHAMGATPVGALTTIAYGPGIFPEEKQARQEAWRLGQSWWRP